VPDADVVMAVGLLVSGALGAFTLDAAAAARCPPVARHVLGASRRLGAGVQLERHRPLGPRDGGCWLTGGMEHGARGAGIAGRSDWAERGWMPVVGGIETWPPISRGRWRRSTVMTVQL